MAAGRASTRARLCGAPSCQGAAWPHPCLVPAPQTPAVVPAAPLPRLHRDAAAGPRPARSRCAQPQVRALLRRAPLPLPSQGHRRRGRRSAGHVCQQHPHPLAHPHAYAPLHRCRETLSTLPDEAVEDVELFETTARFAGGGGCTGPLAAARAPLLLCPPSLPARVHAGPCVAAGPARCAGRRGACVPSLPPPLPSPRLPSPPATPASPPAAATRLRRLSASWSCWSGRRK